jgi:TP901 family phage tail tape measure protein
MPELAKLLVTIGADINEFTEKLDQAEARTKGFSTAAKLAIAGAAAAIGGSLAAVAKEAVQTAADFEAQMNVLSMAARSSGTSLEDLRKAAIQVGADTELVGISASEAADAMTNFYKTGLTTTEIFGDLNSYLQGTASLGGALRAAIDLAAASELNLGEASRAVAVAMKTFGLSAEDATRIANSFIQTADASVAEVSDLVAALENVGPTAASFGWSLEDVNTALAILSTRGIKGAEAGTALKSMLLHLMSGTKETTEALADLGVELYDAEGRLKSLPTIIQELSAALEVGNTRIYQRNALTEQERKKLEELRAEYAELSRKIAAYQNGQLGANMTDEERNRTITRLKNKLEEVAFAMQPLEQASQRYITVTRTMTEEQRNLYAQTLAGSYGIKALNTFVEEGAEGWRAMAEQIQSAATVQESAAARTQGFNAAMEQLHGAIEAFLINVGTPLVQLVLTPGVKLLGEWIGKLAEMVPSVEDISAVVEGAKSTLQSFLGEVSKLISAVAAGDWSTAWNLVASHAQAAIDKGKEILSGFASDISAKLSELASTAREKWPAWRDTIAEALRAGISAAIDFITADIPAFGKKLYEKVSSFIRNAVDSVSKEAGPIGASLGGTIGSALRSAVEWVGENVVPAAQELWGKLMDVLTTALQFANEHASEWGANLGSFLGSVLRQAIGGLVAIVRTLAEGLFNILKSSGEEATGPGQLQLLLDTFLKFFLSFWDSFIATLLANPRWKEDLVAWAKNTWQGIIDGINERVSDIKQAAIDAIQQAYDALLGLPNKFVNIGKDIIGGIITGIKDKAEDLKNTITEHVTNALPGFAKRALGIGSPSTIFAAIGEDIMRGLELGIERAAYRPAQAIRNVTRQTTYNYQYNLTATYQGQPGNLEALLRQLTQELRMRGISAPLGDLRAMP